MSKRSFNGLLCILSLLSGFVLYVFFRPNTYISMLFDGNTVDYLRGLLQPYSFDFLKYYFPDFLWGFALNLGFAAIFEPKGRDVIICVICALVCGTAWESLQYLGMVSGTGDVWDIAMYLVSSVITYIINKKEKTK